MPTSWPRSHAQPFDQGTQLFLAAVAQGMRLDRAQALAAFGLLGSGRFSYDDTAFFPDNPVLGPVADRIRCLHHAIRLAVGGAEGEADCTFFLVDGAIAAIASTRRLRAGWLEDCRCACGGLESIPDFIAPPG